MITSYNFFTSIGVRLSQLFLRFKARTPHRGLFFARNNAASELKLNNGYHLIATAGNRYPDRTLD